MQLEFWIDDELVLRRDIVTEASAPEKFYCMCIGALLKRVEPGNGRRYEAISSAGPDGYSWLHPKASYFSLTDASGVYKQTRIVMVKRDVLNDDRWVYRMRTPRYCRAHGYSFTAFLKDSGIGISQLVKLPRMGPSQAQREWLKARRQAHGG